MAIASERVILANVIVAVVDGEVVFILVSLVGGELVAVEVAASGTRKPDQRLVWWFFF